MTIFATSKIPIFKKVAGTGREFKRTFGDNSNFINTSSRVMMEIKQLILLKFVCSQKFTDRTVFINDRTVFFTLELSILENFQIFVTEVSNF